MLIFPNGILTYSQQCGSALDDNGNPQSAIRTDTKEVRCTINVQQENLRGKNDDGQFKQASYSVLLNMDDVSGEFNPKTIILKHDNKGKLGAFQVQRIEFYSITRTIEIWV